MTAPAVARPGNRVLRATLVWTSWTTAVLAVVGAVVGFAIAGVPGLASALAGVLSAAAFLGITVVSMLAAQRWFGRPDQIGAYFGLIIGTWLLKLVAFIAILLVLRAQPWVQPAIFVTAVVVSVLASVVIDLLAFVRVRVPYVGDIELPGPAEGDDAAS